MMQKNIRLTTILFLLFAILMFSCETSLKKQVAETDNPKIKLLKIRQITFQGRYKLAERLYKEVQAENPTDAALQIAIDYEIAFLYVKRKKYAEAKPKFEAIIKQYDASINSPENIDALPQWPYYLSLKILNDVVEVKLNEKFKFWKRLLPD